MRLKILVLGANGQLGQQCRATYRNHDWDFIFSSKNDLDITSLTELRKIFFKEKPDYVLNFAAYTDVNLAEREMESAFLINQYGPKNVAKACSDIDATLIHISTDYVFDGKNINSYTETDKVNPINIYGQSKLLGENEIKKYSNKYIILRTSWIFGLFKKNFFLTIFNLSKTKEIIEIVADQKGIPTASTSIIGACFNIIEYLERVESNPWGIYHFSNQGPTNWFEFGSEIILRLYYAGLIDRQPEIIPKESSKLDFSPKRPLNSVLNTSKFQKEFNLKIFDWRELLDDLIQELLTRAK